jgi:hypothetical protein
MEGGVATLAAIRSLKTGYLSVCYTTADCQTDSHTLLIFLLYHGVNIQGINGDYIALTGANLPIKNNEKSTIDKQINIFFILFAVGQSRE